MNPRALKKALLGLSCMIAVAVGVYAPIVSAAPKAYAFPVIITGDIPRVLEKQLDALGWIAAKTVIQSITQSVVTWINSGFEGSPAFITDLEENLGGLADAVAEDFIDGLDQVIVNNTGISIRAPFQDQIAAALREEFYRTTSSYGFDVRYPYRDCYGDSGFSLDGFHCQSQNAANNPYGRYELARQELWKQVNQQTQNRLRELDWGNGFLSWRGSCGPYGNQPNENLVQQESTHLGTKDTTYGCSIRTPGTIIEESLGITLTSPLRQLEIADSINEVVAALMTQMVSQVLGGGGLSGVSQPSSGGGRSYLDQATDPRTSLGNGFSQSIASLRSDISSLQADWQRIATAASSARSACVGNASKVQQADAVLTTANARLAEATSLLAELSRIESAKAVLDNSSTATEDAAKTLISDYEAVIRRMGPLAEGKAESQDAEGTQYRQMTQLAASCR